VISGLAKVKNLQINGWQTNQKSWRIKKKLVGAHLWLQHPSFTECSLEQLVQDLLHKEVAASLVRPHGARIRPGQLFIHIEQE
jgi:hypothetical protein